MYACIYCGSCYDQRFPTCTICLETNTLVPLPKQQRVIFERPNRVGVKNLAQVRQLTFSGKEISGFSQLGKLPKVWKALLFGYPGSGKSTLALQIANAYDGNVLYASVEEGLNESFLKKIQTWEITNPNISFSDAKSVGEIKNDLTNHKIDLLIIDSISELGELPAVPEIAQIWILHATKAGNYKGSSDYGHVVDMIVQCSEGRANIEKNRFAPSSRFTIFEKGEAWKA